MQNNEPVRVYYAVMAGLQALLATTAVTDLLSVRTVGIILGVSAAVQVAVGEFVRSKVSPV